MGGVFILNEWDLSNECLSRIFYDNINDYVMEAKMLIKTDEKLEKNTRNKKENPNELKRISL